MLGYALVGSNRLEEAKAFYGELLGGIGASKILDHQSGGALYGRDGKIQFGVVGPYDGKPATVGNGTMVALQLPSRAAVDAFHAKALALGGADEGAPGPRGGENSPFYGCYFRDLDGNKLAAYHMSTK